MGVEPTTERKRPVSGFEDRGHHRMTRTLTRVSEGSRGLSVRRSSPWDAARICSVVVSAPRRAILLLASGEGSVEIGEKSDEDVSVMVLRPSVCGAEHGVHGDQLRPVRAGKLELERSVQLLVSRVPELSVERMLCEPWGRDPRARETAFNLDDVALCQAVERHSEVNHRS